MNSDHKDGLGRFYRTFTSLDGKAIYYYPDCSLIGIDLKKKTILYVDYVEIDLSIVLKQLESIIDTKEWKKICGRDENILFQKAKIDDKNFLGGTQCLLL
ncbi:hypothetical protein M9Y10_041440 [Tritrichomonas musculus]|uniref:Uncharacterized protein n=1 Tax=Tritrichomonas musculus TaxID=1915356 RepID=A0ABR2K5E7_9EUKA